MEPEQPSHPGFVSNSKRFLFTRIFTKANQWNQYFGNWYSFKHCSGDSNPTNTCQFIDPKHRKWRKRMPICLRSTKTMYLLTYLIPVSFFSLFLYDNVSFSILFWNCQTDKVSFGYENVSGTLGWAFDSLCWLKSIWPKAILFIYRMRKQQTINGQITILLHQTPNESSPKMAESLWK